MATVEVTFTPLPVHVRTARLVATAVARRSGVAESLLDEVRLAVGEACSRAVEAHQRHCPGVPIRVSLTDDGERFEVVVTDAVPESEHDLPAAIGLPAGTGSSPDGDGLGLAVIVGLADDVRVEPFGPGTSVTMSWKCRTTVSLGTLPVAPAANRYLAAGVLETCVPLRSWVSGVYSGNGRLPGRRSR